MSGATPVFSWMRWRLKVNVVVNQRSGFFKGCRQVSVDAFHFEDREEIFSHSETMMTLSQCTKADLLWIIKRLQIRCKYDIDLALCDLAYEKEKSGSPKRKSAINRPTKSAESI